MSAAGADRGVDAALKAQATARANAGRYNLSLKTLAPTRSEATCGCCHHAQFICQAGSCCCLSLQFRTVLTSTFTRTVFAAFACISPAMIAMYCRGTTTVHGRADGVGEEGARERRGTQESQSDCSVGQSLITPPFTRNSQCCRALLAITA